MLKSVALVIMAGLTACFLSACGGESQPVVPPASSTNNQGTAKPQASTSKSPAPSSAPAQATAPATTSDLRVVIETSKGPIHLKLFADQTPLTCANFVNLARRGYYDGLTFHRVIADFMIQGGCPLGTGRGNPGYQFEDEIVRDLKHSKPGILSMANAGPGTNGSQFFITHKATPWLDGKHTVFGEVVSQADQDVVNRIAIGDKIDSVRIEGDVSGLMTRMKARVDQWNKVLDAKFPKLRPAQ